MAVYEALNLAPLAIIAGFLLQPYLVPVGRKWDRASW